MQTISTAIVLFLFLWIFYFENAFGSSVPLDGNEQELLVTTGLGLIKGRWSEKFNSVREFVGIPFGQSPTGSNRFRPSKPARPFGKQIFMAIHDQPPCPQIEAGIFVNEDCLHLSVYSPSRYRIGTRQLPVIFWIFGGAFIVGGGWTNGLYSGAQLISEMDAVFVTFNYRVGTFGFLCTSGDNGISGNAGITDQILAFEWVRKHIGAFGGDANNITIQGQSAGALSVMILLQYLPISQYVKRAIIMSSPLGLRFKGKYEASQIGDDFLAEFNCSPHDLSCIQNIPVIQILRKQKLIANILRSDKRIQADFLVYGPIVDFDIINSVPSDWIDGKVKFPNIPIIFGTVEDEASLIAAAVSPLMTLGGWPAKAFTKLGYRRFIERIWKDKAPEILQQYPATTSESGNFNLFLSTVTDYIFVCPARKIATTFSSYNPNIRLYRWSYPGQYLMYGECKVKVCHSSELPIIFGNIPTPSKSYIFLPESPKICSACQWKEKKIFEDNTSKETVESEITEVVSLKTTETVTSNESSNSWVSMISSFFNIFSTNVPTKQESKHCNSQLNVLQSSSQYALRMAKNGARSTLKIIEQFRFFPSLTTTDWIFHDNFSNLLNQFINDQLNVNWPPFTNQNRTYLQFLLPPQNDCSSFSTKEKCSTEIKQLKNSSDDNLCKKCAFWNNLDVYGQY